MSDSKEWTGLKDKGPIAAGTVTRMAALVALSLSLISFVFTTWLLVAVYHSEYHLKRERVLPKLNESYDTVAAAAAVGRLDVLAMLMAVGAIVAGLGLIYSYTSFRAAAISAAMAEMAEKLPSALSNHLAEHGENLLTSALKDAELLAFIQQRFTEIGLDDTESSSQIDDDPTWKEAG